MNEDTFGKVYRATMTSGIPAEDRSDQNAGGPKNGHKTDEGNNSDKENLTQWRILHDSQSDTGHSSIRAMRPLSHQPWVSH